MELKKFMEDIATSHARPPSSARREDDIDPGALPTPRRSARSSVS